MKLKTTLQVLALGALSLSLAACGSYETVDSEEVPLKQKPPERPGELPELIPVQDVHQKYSLLYSASANKTHVMAQFRVRDDFGDTIRFGKSDQVQFSDSPLRIVDGDVIGPLLGMFQGTFYTLAVPGRADGEFVFTDDMGNRVTTPLRVPKLELEAPEIPAKGEEFESALTFSLQTDEGLIAPELSCSLRSSLYDSEGHPQVSSSSARGRVLASGNGECVFSLAELRKHESRSGSLELRAELVMRQKAQDEWEREKEIRITHVKNETFD